MAEPFHRFRREQRAIVEQRLAELAAELSRLSLCRECSLGLNLQRIAVAPVAPD
jgi:hypothetical protein